MIVLTSLFKAYFLLSLLYTVIYFEQNIVFHWRHHPDKVKAIFAIFIALFVSMIFGGVSLLQRSWVWLKGKWKEYKTWYEIAKTAKLLTKKMHDEFDNSKKES
jgi:hypothetical protein